MIVIINLDFDKKSYRLSAERLFAELFTEHSRRPLKRRMRSSGTPVRPLFEGQELLELLVKFL